MKSKDKPKHGGKRPNSGRKQKYKESTVTISFRCPESLECELRRIIKERLELATYVG